MRVYVGEATKLRKRLRDQIMPSKYEEAPWTLDKPAPRSVCQGPNLLNTITVSADVDEVAPVEQPVEANGRHDLVGLVGHEGWGSLAEATILPQLHILGPGKGKCVGRVRSLECYRVFAGGKASMRVEPRPFIRKPLSLDAGRGA